MVYHKIIHLQVLVILLGTKLHIISQNRYSIENKIYSFWNILFHQIYIPCTYIKQPI